MKLKPGKIWWIKDTILQAMGGKVLDINSSAAMPPVIESIIETLRQKRIETSGWTEAARGILPTAGASGELVKSLAAGSEQLMSSKAHSTETAMNRLARLMIHAILTRLELEDLKRLCGEFRDHVLVALVILGREIEWDIKTELAGGSGRQTAAREQRAINLFNTRDNNGVPLTSLQTTREDCDVDHHREKQRCADEARERRLRPCPRRWRRHRPTVHRPKEQQHDHRLTDQHAPAGHTAGSGGRGRNRHRPQTRPGAAPSWRSWGFTTASATTRRPRHPPPRPRATTSRPTPAAWHRRHPMSTKRTPRPAKPATTRLPASMLTRTEGSLPAILQLTPEAKAMLATLRRQQTTPRKRPKATPSRSHP